MIRYVPPFILQQYEQGKLQGRLNGYVFWLGKAGHRRPRGKTEPEFPGETNALGAYLDDGLNGIIAAVEGNGGFICQFEGNTLYAVFPHSQAANILAAAASIELLVRSVASSASPFKDRADGIILRVGYGSAHWRIFSNDLQLEYVFFGQTMEELNGPSRSKAHLEFTPKAAAKLGKEQFRPQGKVLQLMLPVPAAPPIHLDYPHSMETTRRFTQARFHYIYPANDLRRSVCSWIALGDISSPDLEHSVQTLELLCFTYGGFIGACVARRNELRALILFDIPRNGGNKLQRACKFALEAVRNIPAARVACASGMVYSGFSGRGSTKVFTVLGETVAIAANLLSLAKPGEILADAYLKRQLGQSFLFTPRRQPKSGSRDQTPPHYSLSALPANRATGLSSSFIGRQAQLARLQALISGDLGTACGRIIQVWGPPGIGKSRLVAEYVRSLPPEEFHKVFIACQEQLPKPLDAVKQLVAGLLELSADAAGAEGTQSFRRAWAKLAGSNAALWEIESHLASLFGYSWENSPWEMLSPQVRLSQLQEAWLTFTRELVRRKPLLIHLDDGQWLDDQSRIYFRLLGKNGIGPVLILASNRSLGNGTRPGLKIAAYFSHNLKLRPLSKSSSRQLMRSFLGIPRLTGESFALLHGCTGGNPFYIEQYASWLLENGRVDARGRISLTPESSASLGIDQIITSRIAHLSAKVRLCIHSASVLGFRFNVHVLSQMLRDDPRKELSHAAGNSLWKDVDELFYIFSHALIQSAVYHSLKEGELQNLHLAAASAMEIVFTGSLPENAEEIGLHYRKANQLKQAAKYYRRAAEYYWDKGLHSKIEPSMLTAIDLAREAYGEGSPEYIEERFSLALLYHYLQRMDEAGKIYRQVIRAKTRELGPDSLALSPYLNNLGRFYKDTGRYPEAEKLLLRTLEMEKIQSPNSSNVADRINNLGHLYSIMDRWDEAEARFREALELMERNYDSRHWFLAPCLGNLGSILLKLGRLDEAEPLLLRSVQISLHHWGEQHYMCSIFQNNLGRLHLAQGRFAEAETIFRQVLAVREIAFGKDHPNTLLPVRELLDLYTQTGNADAASLYRNRLQT